MWNFLKSKETKRLEKLRDKRMEQMEREIKYLFRMFFEGFTDYTGNLVTEPVMGIKLERLGITKIDFEYKIIREPIAISEMDVIMKIELE